MSVYVWWKHVESIWKKYFEWSIWTNTSTDKKYLKNQNTKYSICSISNTNTKYKKYFKYVFEIQVFQILPTSDFEYITSKNTTSLY